MNRRFRSEFNRMVQLGLGRGDKSEIMTKDMEDMCNMLQSLQETCQTLTKKLKEGIPNYPGEPDKRQKKLPEFLLAQTKKECSRNVSEFYNSSSFGTMLNCSADLDELLAKEQVQYEILVEEHVLKPLVDLDADYKTTSKLKKQLQKLCADMETARRKYNSAARQSSMPTSENNTTKITQTKDELDEITKQVDHLRDALSTEIFIMISREGELSDILMKHAQLKTEYHRQALRIFDSLQPEMQTVHETILRPVFGAPLCDDLRRTKRAVALVLEFCAVFLYHNSLNEEGLFRVAGSTSKVKMLKAAFDAQLGDEFQNPVLNLMNCDADHHNVASTLKCYLRELPEPLTGLSLYNDWMDTLKVEDTDDRRKALTRVISKLPRENYDNLGYLVKFLAAVASHSDKNKMPASNLAIVMSPNLFWNSDSERSGYDMAAANQQHTLVEAMITHQKELFPGDFDSASSHTIPRQPNVKDSTSLDLPDGSNSSGSPRPVTPPEQPSSPKTVPKSVPFKAKKAPPPPSIPKRTENVPLVKPIPSPKPVFPSANSIPEPQLLPKPQDDDADPVKSEEKPVSKLYPDISEFADDTPASALVGLEPTVVPVAYNPSFPVTGIADKVAASPLPATRRRGGGGGSGTIMREHALTGSDPSMVGDFSRGGIQRSFGGFSGARTPTVEYVSANEKSVLGSPADVGNGVGNGEVGVQNGSNGETVQGNGRPGRPPPPPKRVFSDSTYL